MRRGWLNAVAVLVCSVGLGGVPGLRAQMLHAPDGSMDVAGAGAGAGAGGWAGAWAGTGSGGARSGAGVAGPVGVRVGDHPGFGRLVFDLPAGVTSQAAMEGDRLLLVFSANATAGRPGGLPRNVVGFEARPGSATLVVAPGAQIRPLRIGSRMVVDVLDPPDAAPVAPVSPASPKPAGRSRPGGRWKAEPRAQAPEPASEGLAPNTSALTLNLSADLEATQRAQAGEQVREQIREQAEAGRPVAEAAPTVPVVREALAGRGLPQAEDASSAGAPGPEPGREVAAPAVAASPVGSPAGGPSVRPAGYAPFVVPADASVGAAAFRRGGFGLVVFDRRLGPVAVPWADGQAVPGAVTTTIQVPLGAEWRLRLARVASGWRIETTETEWDGSQAGGLLAGGVEAAEPAPGRASKPSGEVKAGEAKAGDAATLFGLPRPGRSVAVVDPTTGGALLVGTSLTDGPESGFAGTRRAPDHVVLPSWLGVVVEPLSDQLELRAGAGGFVLRGSAAAPAGPMARGRQFDLPDEPVAALSNRLKGALASAAAAAPRARSRPRVAAAQAYIALGLGMEAQSLLSLVAAEDPQMMADARFVALGGMAAVLAGRPEEADGLDDPRLMDPAMEGGAEIGLWQGLRDRRLGRETPAALGLAAGSALAWSYPPTLRRSVWPDVAEAAVEAGVAVPETQLPRFARALRLERAGRVEEALAAYAALRAGTDRLDQVRATLREAELGLASGRIGPGAAADTFERQGFAWRGDAMEARTRIRAAELRAAAGGWRAALDQLRATEAAFPDQRAVVAARKAAVFQSMLAADGAGLSPLEVVMMASDYADCVPEGAAGGVLAALLADKLTALDLPARTIPVLQGLVRATVAGPGRAEFGARLAHLLLEAGDAPGAALALRSSEAPGLPPALLDRRALLVARAQAAQGDVAAAASGLVAAGTPAADELRATLLAGAGDWRGSYAALGALASKTVPALGVLSDSQQDVLLRQASAAVQMHDPAALATLLGHAARMTGARADLFRVLTAPPVGQVAELPRAATELRLARAIPQRLGEIGGR